MRKMILQGMVMVLAFLGLWFALERIDWEGLLKVNRLTEQTEEKLGELLNDVFIKESPEIYSRDVVEPIDSIVSKVCRANSIDRSKIKVHVLENSEVNAFALPGGSSGGYCTMGGSLMQRRRVRDGGLRVVNLCFRR